ncbi:MAG: malonyl-ACP O-methyltransferase BioC [Bacteroidetes bacterium]|nr:malonyl-ACP O-methyltransferase BioC [Bacteroidota bacterium]
MYITDKEIVRNRFNRNFVSYNREAVVQQQIAEKLASMLSKFCKTELNRVLEIGCGTGFLSKNIISDYLVDEYFLNDIAESAFKEIAIYANSKNFYNYKFIHGDAETAVFPENINTIISTSTFQWFNNIEKFISKINYVLNDTGIIAFSTFGKNNFKEIKAVSNVGLEYKTLKELKTIIEPYFNILHAEEWIQKEQFNSPKDVLKHIKLTGVNGLKNEFFGKEKLIKFTEEYQKQFSNNNKTVNLTYHPIIIIAKKRYA